MELVFATNNLHKLQEIRNLVSEGCLIKSLSDVGISTSIPEDYPTLEENAAQKAWYIYNQSGLNCFADDTGLEVDALGGEPGVYSARYSRIGDLVFPEMDVVAGNIHKLVLRLKEKTDRTARFRTVISLIINGEEFAFEGRVEGRIIDTPRGKLGFGYDPVFVPDGYQQTFAEMDLSEKNRISHRARAMKKLVGFLEERTSH